MSWLLLALMCMALAGGAAAENILFIGNSYTFYNKLPDLFKEVATSAGVAGLQVESATAGGLTFSNHLSRPGTLAQIDKGNWDVVILQGHSTEAARAGVAGSFLKSSAGLYDRIKKSSPKAKVVLYQTWARHADWWLNSTNANVGGRNPAEMQMNTRRGYQLAAAQRPDFVIAPCGDAWELNYKNPDALQLHDKDKTHPGYNGSYLTALVLYATIYHPTNLDIAFGPDKEKKYLQKIAAEAVKSAGQPATAPVAPPRP
jgi:hypothetical protein